MDNTPVQLRGWKRLPVHMTVRTWLILVLIIGSGLGWVVHLSHIQRDAVNAIQKAGGKVAYEWDFSDGTPHKNGKPGWPRWLVELVGVDYFGNVTVVYNCKMITDDELAQVGRLHRIEILNLFAQPLSDAGLAQLKGLTKLRQLILSQTQITDAGMVHLKNLTGLQELCLDGTQVGDEGLSELKELTGLRELMLTNCPRVTDDGIAHLKGLTKLRKLSLTGTAVSRDGARMLRQSMLSVEIPSF